MENEEITQEVPDMIDKKYARTIYETEKKHHVRKCVAAANIIITEDNY